MVEIPQYTRQIIAEPESRTKVNIKEPDTFSDRGYMRERSKIVSEFSKDMAETFVEMKNTRDQGIVDEYMNQFSIASSDAIKKFQEKYKGANAQQIIKAYNDWQEQYFADHTGFNQNTTDNTLFLENQEQINSAREQMKKSLPRVINNLSAYSARELEDYRNNQFNARIEFLAEDLSNENDMNNIASLKNNIMDNLNQRYSGQSPEFLKQQSRRIIGAAMATNIANGMDENPILSLQKLNNKFFIDDLDNDTVKKLKHSAVKSYIEWRAQGLANDRANNYSTNSQPPEEIYETILPILKEFNEETVRAEVVDKADKKYNDIMAKQNAAQASFNNNITLNTSKALYTMYDPNSSDLEKEDANDKLNNIILSAVNGDQSTRNMFEIVKYAHQGSTEYFDELKRLDELEDNLILLKRKREGEFAEADLVKDYDEWNKEKAMEQLVDSPLYKKVQISKSQIDYDRSRVAEYIDRINHGDYKDLSSFDFTNMHPVSIFDVIERINQETEYNNFKNEVKTKSGNGFKVDEEIRKSYKSQTGATPDDSPFIYNMYRDEMKDMIRLYANQKKSYPTQEDISDISRLAWANLSNREPAQLSLLNIAGQEKEIKKDLITDSGSIYVSAIDLKDKFIEEFNRDKYLDTLDETQKEELADYLIVGNYNAASQLIKDNISYEEKRYNPKFSFVY